MPHLFLGIARGEKISASQGILAMINLLLKEACPKPRSSKPRPRGKQWRVAPKIIEHALDSIKLFGKDIIHTLSALRKRAPDQFSPRKLKEEERERDREE